ncbi:dihydroneopterin aldolase [Meiothermus sp. QL-1]|uniref:dihydroneopterin aldolase n=1 Tax=Meiothermus sp. QL-1 TaxID=2058095 RepID=UPI000E0C057B|nr:dihydroneopterin aldolase [Meiothermus sp. QL-1]RDI96729.1 dihydroneopterin aldolase [Meiothermus sp. QL-1]
MGRVVLAGIELYARHGLHAEEERLGARFVVDVEMEVAFEGRPDRLASTVDYSAVFLLVQRLATERRFYLIEALADHLADEIMARFAEVQAVVVRVHKPHAPLPGVVRDVFVETLRRR